MVLDGAWGTLLQSYSLSEEEFRGDRFRDHSHDLRGCMDVLVLTQPAILDQAHRQYLEAGADILETNTFTANHFAMLDYGLEDQVYEINFEATRMARRAADEYTERRPDKPRFVAGVLGPTNKTASVSPDVSDPAYRDVTFMELADAYTDSTRGLLDGVATGVGHELLESIDRHRAPPREGSQASCLIGRLMISCWTMPSRLLTNQ